MGTSLPIPISSLHRNQSYKSGSITDPFSVPFQNKNIDNRDRHAYLQFIDRNSELELAVSKIWALKFNEAFEILCEKTRNMILPRFALHMVEVHICQGILYDSITHLQLAQQCIQKAHHVCQKMLTITEPHTIAQALSENPSFESILDISSNSAQDASSHLSNYESNEMLNDPEILFWKLWRLECNCCLIVNRI